MNPMNLLKIWTGLLSFSSGHPDFVPFLKDVAAAGAGEGTLVEMKVTTPEGNSLNKELELSAEDVELIRMIRELVGGEKKSADQAETEQIDKESG
ncbi:MAG: hypothetical protein IK115_12460 [Lachnospiraceae bacterium]|nr:hypothetical protein [Lachnospiraceae bacterium]